MVDDLPAHDFTGEYIENEHRVDPPGLGRNIGDVSYPKRAGGLRGELAVHQIHRA